MNHLFSKQTILRLHSSNYIGGRGMNNETSVYKQRHDDDCVRPALIACTYWSSVDLQSAVAHSQFLALRYGTTCRLTSQLHHHSRSSDSASRHFCFCAHTLTLANLQTICTRLLYLCGL